MQTILLYTWLILGGTLLTIGDLTFKLWVEKTIPFLYWGGLLLYTLGAMCLIETYKTQNIAVATALLVIINILTLVLASHFWFDEHLTVKQLLGIGCSIIAIVLLH